MRSDTERVLDGVVATAMQRWGAQALRRGSAPPMTERLPTGIAGLDALLGGGLPRGALSVWSGSGTSGAGTLALHALAAAQQCGVGVVALDTAHAFDVQAAAAVGVALDALILARPTMPSAALDLIPTLAAGGAGLIVADALPGTAAQIQGLLRRLAATPCALLAVGPAAAALAGQAALALTCQVTRWDLRDPRVLTADVQTTLTRQRQGPVGASVTILLRFPIFGGAA